MISGLSHITLVVRDLHRAAALLTGALDAVEVYSSGDRTFSLSREKFFLLGGLWLCLMEGEPPAERGYAHVALKVPEVDLDGYRARLEAHGAEIRPDRPRIGAEGRSVYFYDFDNHLFELHTGSLEARLAGYEAAVTGEDQPKEARDGTGSVF
jgi:catechol 2,3-dioxygenase-like lactoylglutathione lyase family enzyme